MGNIAYITTKKHVKSYYMIDLLHDINQRRFDGKMTIIPEHGGWSVGYEGWDGEWDRLWIHSDSPRKLSCKHPSLSWMSYVFIVFLEELGVMTNGIMSDEGISDRWKPAPQKYSSWNTWMELRYSHVKDQALFKQCVDGETSFVPKGMEKY